MVIKLTKTMSRNHVENAKVFGFVSRVIICINLSSLQCKQPHRVPKCGVIFLKANQK